MSWHRGHTSNRWNGGSSRKQCEDVTEQAAATAILVPRATMGHRSSLDQPMVFVEAIAHAYSALVGNGRRIIDNFLEGKDDSWE